MLDPSSWSAPTELRKLERRFWIIGGAGIVVSILGALLDRPQALQSYLVAWLLWTGIAFGCFAVLSLHHLTRGGWGLMVQRVLEAAAKTLPLLALLFVPILLGMSHVYTWADPEVVAASEYLQKKTQFLNVPFFAARFVAYFVILAGLTWILTSRSLKMDRTGDAKLVRRMQNFAGPGLGIYVLVSTLAAIDWIMSLDPLWVSTLFGVYFVGGHGVSAFAFLITVAVWLSHREPMSRAFTKRHFHDYGKLLFAFVMLWAYFAVSQGLIIWSGNVAEKIPWYVERVRNGWEYLFIAMGLLHFALPFLLLLSRNLKRNARRLATVATLLLVMRWVDLYWQVAPNFHHALTVHWLDLATVVGLGGIWLATVFNLLGRHPLLPVNDPDIEGALPGE